jgi:N-acetylglucosamine malate deacetylase 2
MLADWLRRPAVIVAAHPDDEVIGMGSLLPRFADLRAIIHVTDGAPRRGNDIAQAGVGTWQEYAAKRRREFQSALAELGIPSVRQICLWCPDQEASFRMAEIGQQLCEAFAELQPHFVFTHAYEGGHPDHDATAVSVHRAAQLLRSTPIPEPAILEFASYHAGTNGIETGCFLPHLNTETIPRQLSEGEKIEKRKLFNCYESQQNVLQYFSLDNEPLRVAPEYDFTKPPHEGTLFYERFDWGLTGQQWRRLATEVR